MNLFFETSRQASCFLCMFPVGLALAFCLDVSLMTGRVRIVLDVLVLLLAGISVLSGVVLFGETTLRVYHLLGLAAGAILYTEGVGKVIRWLIRKQELIHRMKK